MKQRLADYVADFLVARGVTDVFSVVGGGAMHLNDALGHNPRLHVTYNHHEQACAIAAEAYARLENKIAAVCVTTGPGGTNALTGVVGGWLDSIPMFIVSGQVRYDTTARYALQYTGTRHGRPGVRHHQVRPVHDEVRRHAGGPQGHSLPAGKGVASGYNGPPRPGLAGHPGQLPGRLHRD